MGGATVSGGTAERTCSAPNQTHSIASFAAHRSNNQYVSHALGGNHPVSRVPYFFANSFLGDDDAVALAKCTAAETVDAIRRCSMEGGRAI